MIPRPVAPRAELGPACAQAIKPWRPNPPRRLLSLRGSIRFRSALATLLLALALPLQAAPPVEDSIAQRVQACTGCHGRQGRAASDGYHPRIAGKPAGYLYQQLLGFRDGRRHYALMTGLLEPLSDAYLQEIAGHFASLELPYPPPQPATAPVAVLARGEALVRRGDAARGLPACAQCHGEALMGVAPAVPGLLGLPRDYLAAQLGAWQRGARRAQAPDCMAQIASRLGEADLAAVAQWLAAQPVPAGAKPQAAGRPALKPPMDCGSMAEPARADRTDRPEPRLPPDPQIERGAYLARAGHCAGCHTARGGAPYAGGRAIETPFGTVYGSNLTPDPDTGLGSWSAADFRRALHEGRSRDGRLLVPAFPYPNYSRVSAQDADALFAYLRSLPPVRQANRPHALRFPYGTQAALAAWRALYFRPATHRDDPSRPAEWNRGAYLVQGLGHCGACHGARNALGAVNGALEGGPRGGHGGGFIDARSWYAPALDDPREAGVAGWSEAEVVALLKTGRTQDPFAGSGGSARDVAQAGAQTGPRRAPPSNPPSAPPSSPVASVLGPMAEVVRGSTSHLTDADLRAMAAYLRSLPQAAGAAAPSAGTGGPSRAQSAEAASTAAAGAASPGAALYERHCAACHGERGEGAPGAYPPLAGNRAVVMATSTNLLRVLLEGGFAPSTAGNPRPYGMPPFATVLNDQEAAAVLTHIRSSWGHQAGPVTALEVLRARGGR